MSRPVHGGIPKDTVFNIRASAALVAAIDRGVAAESKRIGASINRSQFIRGILFKAVGLNPAGEK
jgi:hypothetical protein